jgi:hypothetical protein
VRGFADCINKSLKQDPDLKDLLPIDGLSDALFKAVHHGILLCKLASPDALDERVIATGKKLSTFPVLANITLALSTAKSLGLSIEPECCTPAPLRQIDLCQRADGMLAVADKIDCQKFVEANEIVQGQARLNLRLVANVFNTQLHFPTAFLPGLICIHPGGRYSNYLPPGRGETEGCGNSTA